MQKNKKSSKRWLNQVKYIDTEIRSLICEQSRLMSKGLVASAPSSTSHASPVYGNINEDRCIEYARYSDLINKRIEELYALKADIHTAIEAVPNSMHRIVLREHYINGKEFLAIATELEKSYDHVVHNLHPSALRAVKVPKKYLMDK